MVLQKHHRPGSLLLSTLPEVPPHAPQRFHRLTYRLSARILRLCRQAFDPGLGGYVAAVGFALAAHFARTWAVRLLPACGCVVRRGGGLVWVSVPVAVAGSPPACRQAVASGGVWAW